MGKRLQVLIDDQEYSEIRRAAQQQRLTISEWARQAMRKAREGHSANIEAKLQAIAEASRHEFPTADIEDMLREIESGRRIS